MKRALVAVAVGCGLVLAGAGCGGSSPSTVQLPAKATVAVKAPVVPVKVVSGHVCDSKDFAQGCALPPAVVPEIARAAADTTSLQGVDFAWSCPISSARSFGASYLSNDTSKNWTRTCVNEFHAQHKGTVAVWEAGANDAEGGYSLGYSQAKQAASQLAALGAPANQPFTMAVDCDCAGSSLVGYFQGANKAEPGRVNAYGGYDQVAYLYSHHLVGHLNWQTYAWSGGRWLSASIAPLEQYLNSTSVDYDRAIAANYGQWPYAADHVANGPHCFSKHPDLKSATCKRVRSQVHKLWTELHFSIHHARTKGCVLLWVDRHGVYRLRVGLKTGPLCTKIGHNAARERKVIDTTWARYK